MGATQSNLHHFHLTCLKKVIQVKSLYGYLIIYFVVYSSEFGTTQNPTAIFIFSRNIDFNRKTGIPPTAAHSVSNINLKTVQTYITTN